MATSSSVDRRLEIAVKIVQEILVNKSPRAFGVFKNGMKTAGFTLSPPDAASLYAQAGATIRKREAEKAARLAPPSPAVAASSSAAAAAAAAEPEADDDNPLPLGEEFDSEDDLSPQVQEGADDEGEETWRGPDPQYMPFQEALDSFFLEYQDDETLEEFEERIAQGVTVVAPEEQALADEATLDIFEEAHTYLACKKANLTPVGIRHRLVTFAPKPMELPEVAAVSYTHLTLPTIYSV